jgi:hypothetical protein
MNRYYYQKVNMGAFLSILSARSRSHQPNPEIPRGIPDAEGKQQTPEKPAG